MSRGLSEAHPPTKVKHDTRSNGENHSVHVAEFCMLRRRLSRLKAEPRTRPVELSEPLARCLLAQRPNRVQSQESGLELGLRRSGGS